jgi:hypothetical protein
MILIEGDPSKGMLFWHSEDNKFSGALVPGFTLLAADGEAIAMPAGALLAVPKYSRSEPPSINKYSPLIVQASTVDEVVSMLQDWEVKNKGASPWDLRAP